MPIVLTDEQAKELRRLIRSLDDPDQAATEGDKDYSTPTGDEATAILDKGVKQAEKLQSWLTDQIFRQPKIEHLID